MARVAKKASDAPEGASLPTEADVAIVGAGVMGLALAYNLALLGQKRVVVLDAHYLAWGASGRNGGGVRQQWSTENGILSPPTSRQSLSVDEKGVSPCGVERVPFCDT